MVEKALNDYLSSIAPYQKLWATLRVSGIAVNLNGAWFNVAIRGEFAESSPARKEMHSPAPHFLHYVVDFPINAMQAVVRRIVLEGVFELKSGKADSGSYASISMKRERENTSNVAPSPVQWSPFIREAGLPGDSTGQKRTSMTLGGFGQSVQEVLSYEMSRKIEARLRIANPGYDGLAGLFAHLLPGASYSGRDNTLLEIVAELPFELRRGAHDTVVVEGAARTPKDSLLLRCFYGPGTGLPPSVTALQGANAETLADGRLRWTERPPWPDGSASARAGLFFEGEQVQMLDVKRWPSGGNLRQLVDLYFDPSQERLRAVLLNRGLMNQHEFEWGVARLLNLLGVPAAWYGKGAAPGRPDLGGYVEDGPVLLAECTLEKPSEKFSGLAERTKRLLEQLGEDTEVLPVVFTRADTVDSEKQQAREHGVVVVGQTELRDLLKFVESGMRTGEFLTYLQQLRSNVTIELGALLNGRWAPKW
jgi:hypothetical protein